MYIVDEQLTLLSQLPQLYGKIWHLLFMKQHGFLKINVSISDVKMAEVQQAPPIGL